MNNFIVKTSGLLMVIMLLANYSQAISNEGRGGGGGLYRDGIYMTFGSAGIYVDPKPQLEVPGLKLLEKAIMALPVDSNVTTELLKAISVQGRREYFRVVEDKLTEEDKKKILEEYARVVNQPIDHLKVFAFTESGKEDTFLLPEFFKLKEIEQAAILLHEALWILSPTLSYKTVIEIEITFQSHLEKWLKGGGDVNFAKKFGALIQDESIILNMALSEDLRNRSLSSFGLDKNGISVGALLNPRTDQCRDVYSSITLVSDEYSKYVLNKNNSLEHMINLTHKYPNSIFIKELMNVVTEKGLTIFVFSGKQKASECDRSEYRKQKIKLFRMGVQKFRPRGEWWGGYEVRNNYAVAEPQRSFWSW